ncbi:MAG: hypothetical protein WAP23_03545 [Candidatus Spechtbacterales bacterium]
MDYRHQKQVIIGLVSFIGLFAALFIFVFLFAGMRSATSPKLQDGADKPLFKDLEVIFTDFFEIKRHGTFDALAYIKNPNLEYGSSNISYEFIFLDSGGREIYKILGKSFILPKESRYIIEPAIKLTSELDSGPIRPAGVEFRITGVTWQRLAPFSSAGLDLIETNLKRDANISASRFSGIVSNESPYNLKNVEVDVLLYTGGKPVAAGRTDMQDLLRGTDRFFQIMWPYILATDASIDARVESNFFENSNFIKDYSR